MLPPTSAAREHRLYQASFLLRDYGFDLEELPFTSLGNLPLETDPKQAWAQVNLAEQPIEVNRADRRELLRIAAQSALDRSQGGRTLIPDARAWAKHWAGMAPLLVPMGPGNLEPAASISKLAEAEGEQR